VIDRPFAEMNELIAGFSIIKRSRRRGQSTGSRAFPLPAANRNRDSPRVRGGAFRSRRSARSCARKFKNRGDEA
jgi:hypothetical protein